MGNLWYGFWAKGSSPRMSRMCSGRACLRLSCARQASWLRAPADSEYSDGMRPQMKRHPSSTVVSSASESRRIWVSPTAWLTWVTRTFEMYQKRIIPTSAPLRAQTHSYIFRVSLERCLLPAGKHGSISELVRSADDTPVVSVDNDIDDLLRGFDGVSLVVDPLELFQCAALRFDAVISCCSEEKTRH